MHKKRPKFCVKDETFRFFENAADQRLPSKTRWAIVAEDVAESTGIPEENAEAVAKLFQFRGLFGDR